MANALLHEKSPYLQQHAHNPVDWLPWGDTAFEKARREEKPIFLSIGYSTCHWCHVMERESFENEEIAALLNANFVPVKVDREERPDVDRVYMLFVQASTGSGGWPMSVWLTPDRKPFFGGTYFPPDARWGRASFPDILQQIAQAWRDRREDLLGAGDRVTTQLQAYAAPSPQTGELNWDLFHAGFPPLRRSFDKEFGGFGSAPKFPRPVALHYLMREFAVTRNEEASEMAVETLAAMRAGGMNDQLGGGFHRYSVDRHWFVPHFEKMLYDQAQLASAYIEAFQITGDEAMSAAAREIFTYVLRDMRHSEGGFYSAEDADSTDPENPAHKGEGAFYIWRQQEIEQLLGDKRAAIFCLRYGVRPEGNVAEDPHGEFTGRNILFEAVPEKEIAAQFNLSEQELRSELRQARETLFAAREKRPRPHLDDKILTSWNSLMISALAKAAWVLKEPKYVLAAQRATSFLLKTMYKPETGKLLRRYRDGEAAVEGFLDDYAFFAQALLDLFQADGNPEHLLLAARLAKDGFKPFEDAAHGGFFSTAETGEPLLLRMKDDYDGAEPSGNSVATDVLLRLTELTGDYSYRAAAEKSLRSFAPNLREQPVQAPLMLAALGRYLSVPTQTVVRVAATDDGIDLLDEYRLRFEPYRIALFITDAAQTSLGEVAPFLAGLPRKGSATVYECSNFVCQLPRVIE